MGVHQVVAAAAPGDVATTAALGLQPLLARLGSSELFAHRIDPAMAGQAVPLGDCAAVGADVLVYHASGGAPAVAEFLRGRPEPLVVWYHPLIPLAYLAGADPSLAARVGGGRADLAGLASRAALGLASTPAGVTDLAALGYADTRLADPVVDPAALAGVTPDPALTARLAELDGPVALFAGAVLPHDRVELLLCAYYALSTYLAPAARLAVAGPAEAPRYRRLLERMVGELCLDAWIMGGLTRAELAAVYRRASCFVSLTEGDGMSVPVLEAMAMGLPVVATRAGGAAGAVEGAALLLAGGDDVLLTAEAIFAVLTDGDLAGELRAAGRELIGRFDPDVARAGFLRHLADVL